MQHPRKKNSQRGNKISRLDKYCHPQTVNHGCATTYKKYGMHIGSKLDQKMDRTAHPT